MKAGWGRIRQYPNQPRVLKKFSNQFIKIESPPIPIVILTRTALACCCGRH